MIDDKQAHPIQNLQSDENQEETVYARSIYLPAQCIFTMFHSVGLTQPAVFF